MSQICFQINKSDNVATALYDLSKGNVKIYGESLKGDIVVLENVNVGHKIALVDISKGSDVIKYGVVIGETTKDVRAGEWVHLQNMRSKYDARSSKLDMVTGVPTDTEYD